MRTAGADQPMPAPYSHFNPRTQPKEGTVELLIGVAFEKETTIIRWVRCHIVWARIWQRRQRLVILLLLLLLILLLIPTALEEKAMRLSLLFILFTRFALVLPPLLPVVPYLLPLLPTALTALLKEHSTNAHAKKHRQIYNRWDHVF